MHTNHSTEAISFQCITRKSLFQWQLSIDSEANKLEPTWKAAAGERESHIRIVHCLERIILKLAIIDDKSRWIFCGRPFPQCQAQNEICACTGHVICVWTIDNCCLTFNSFPRFTPSTRKQSFSLINDRICRDERKKTSHSRAKLYDFSPFFPY